MPIDRETRRAPTWLLVAVLALLLPWSWFVNLWFAERELYRPLVDASDGLLHPALQVCLPSALLLLLVLRLAGLRIRDVGLVPARLPVGILATLVLWILANAVALVGLGGELTWARYPGKSLSMVVGHPLGQFLGNALFEELVYRGLFLAQFVLLLRARGLGAKRTAWLAALLSAVVFAVPHIPNRLMKDDYEVLGDVFADQGRLLFQGMILAWVYLRTGNLWWTIGLHGLANYPTLALAWELGGSPKAAIAGWGLLITAVWPWVFGRWGSTVDSTPRPDLEPPSRS